MKSYPHTSTYFDKILTFIFKIFIYHKLIFSISKIILQFDGNETANLVADFKQIRLAERNLTI